MNRAMTVLALAGVTFVEGFLGALLAAPLLTALDPSVWQSASVGAGGAALSVILNGLGDLHGYLAARADA